MIPVIIVDHKIKSKEIEDNIAYLVAGNGFFIFRRTESFESISPVDKLPSLMELDPMIAITKLDKIPSFLLYRTINFFKQVYDKHKTEAIILITRNRKTKEYGLHCPEQEVGGASVEWKEELSLNGSYIAGTIHSHADFGAFHSGTDQSDASKLDGFHITIGNVTDKKPSFAGSFVASGVSAELKINQIFTTASGDSTFPKTWLDKVKKEVTYVYGFTGSGSRKFEYDKSYDYHEFQPCWECPVTCAQEFYCADCEIWKASKRKSRHQPMKGASCTMKTCIQWPPTKRCKGCSDLETADTKTMLEKLKEIKEKRDAREAYLKLRREEEEQDMKDNLRFYK